MVNCSNCGFDAGESKFCPNCGTEVVEERSTTICSNCGFDVGESKFCPNCGTKVEIEEEVNSICPNCGADVGESKFCPECGTKIEKEISKSFCPKCGEELNDSAKFCPNCGFSKSQENSQSQNASKSTLDKAIDVDDKVSKRMSKLMGRSKIMDKTLDVAASASYRRSKGLSSTDIKYYEKIEPLFIEALETIDDEFVKSILIYERSMASSSGGVVGVVAAQVYTPTKDMAHDEAIMFYQEWANDIKREINKEKQNGTFNEEEFYKKRVKKATLDNTSFLGISKSVKQWNENKK